MRLARDPWILYSFIALLAFGLLMVASASMVISDRQFAYPLHYFFRQAIFVGIGISLAIGVSFVPSKVWERSSILIMLGSLGLLLLVLIPHIGHVVNGSRRWISLGFISLQASEVAKLGMVIYMASYLHRYQDQVQTEFMGFLKPMIILGILGVLLLGEPDFGAATVISLTMLVLLFISGVRLWPFLALFALVLIIMVTLAITSPYRLQRITSFLNPWGTAYGSGYQLTQSLIAFGRGGIFGVGLGNSIQKLFYLPEAHTDFIFAVIAEELGLIGEVFLILLYGILITRIIVVGRRAQLYGKLFLAYVAYGVGIWLALQAMINMGVDSGLLPTKGLTLPFISNGGSSLLIDCVVIGIILRIAREVRNPT